MSTRSRPTNIGDDLAQVLDRISDRNFELAYLRNSGTFRLAERLRRSPAAGMARALRRQSDHVLSIRALGSPGAGGGQDVWVLRISGRPGETGVPWPFVQSAGFSLDRSMFASHGTFARATKGQLSTLTGEDPEIEFQAFPWGGKVEVEFDGRSEVIDLHSLTTRSVIIRPARQPMLTRQPEPTPAALVPSSLDHAPASSPTRSASDEAFLARVAQDKPEVVAIHCPRWLGISSATRILFPHCYHIPESASIDPKSISDVDLDRHASVLAESGVSRFVISGGDHMHRRLIMKVKAHRPEAVFDVLWHGSYVQFQDDYEWAAVKGWVEAARGGLIRGVATVKAGMEDFFRSLGVPSSLLLNYIPGDPLPPPELPPSPVHAGVWISGVSFRKYPHAMLAALKMMGDVRLHGAGMDERARELAHFIGLEMAEVFPQPLPHATLLDAIRNTHLTMYVTFSECCPMLPLESLRVGVPCLVGPVSHLFEDDRFLFDHLVVPFPDRADVIARYARRAVELRTEIISRYSGYVRDYNNRARESVRAFLEEGPTLTRA